MANGILKFDLFEEREEFENALNGAKYKCIIWDILQFLRSEVKYSMNLKPETEEAYEEVRKKIYELLRDSSLDGDF